LTCYGGKGEIKVEGKGEIKVAWCYYLLRFNY